MSFDRRAATEISGLPIGTRVGDSVTLGDTTLRVAEVIWPNPGGPGVIAWALPPLLFEVESGRVHARLERRPFHLSSQTLPGHDAANQTVGRDFRRTEF